MIGKWDKDCISCNSIRGINRIKQIPRVLETKHFVVEHISTSIRGWVVIVPKRHVTAVHQLTKGEMIEYGELPHAVCQGQHELYDTEKEYFMQYSEGESFSHTHVHVVPRLPEWPSALKGPRVFSAMGAEVENVLTAEERTAEALKLREYLLENLPAKLIIK
jgi:diadenosine tetraphosphate (Ap4A) HIT family hydrolase